MARRQLLRASIVLPIAWTIVGACGGAQPQGSVKHRGTKAIAPWAFGDEAADPTVAVLLGTGPSGTATVVEVKPQGSVTVQVAGERGVQRLELMATARGLDLPGDPGPAGASTISIELGIAGRAAARLLGKEVEAYEWAAKGEGDGHAGAIGAPNADEAAEAMMAVGFAAALTGGAIDSRTTLVAAVLPDGSLGLVDGLPERVAALAAAGKKRIGVAAATAVSGESGKAVRLQSEGAEVVVLADVAAAYAFATGSALPATLDAREAELALSGDETAQLVTTYAAWQRRISGEWAALLLLDNAARLPVKIGQLATVALREAKLAEELRVAGSWSAAIDRLMEATAVSGAAVAAFRVVELMQQAKLDEAIAALRERDVVAEASAVVLAIGDAARPTSGEQLHHLALAGNALRAVALARASATAVEEASAALRAMTSLAPGELGSAATARSVTSAVVPALVASRRAAVAAEGARLLLELRDGGGGAARRAEDLARVLPDEKLLAPWRGTLDPSRSPGEAAGAAGDGAAGAAGAGAPGGLAGASLPASTTAAISPLAYPEAAMIELGATWPPELSAMRARWGERSPQWLLTRWAASLTAAQLAAQMLAERRSLGGRRDAMDGQLTIPAGPFTNALPAMLAAADRHARQTANAARVATGAVPLGQRLAYQLGHQLARRPEPALQVRALHALWWSTAVGEAALRLARAARAPYR
jgi:hypothetical protein